MKYKKISEYRDPIISELPIFSRKADVSIYPKFTTVQPPNKKAKAPKGKSFSQNSRTLTM